MVACGRLTEKRESSRCHIFATGDTTGHNDNLQRHQRRQSWHYDNCSFPLLQHLQHLEHKTKNVLNIDEALGVRAYVGLHLLNKTNSGPVLSSLITLPANVLASNTDHRRAHWLPLEQKCRHFDDIFVTSCIGCCHNENFQCSQWWKCRQNGVSDSVTTRLNTASFTGLAIKAFEYILWIRRLYLKRTIRSHEILFHTLIPQ